MTELSTWVDRLVEAVEQTVGDRSHWPEATYRLQFHKDDLTFRDAAQIAPFLDELGISHVYASPYFKTRSGSPHGYAVVDYTRLNPDLGTADDYQAMVDAIQGNRMGQLLDVVPNHMAADPENPWWRDVLENGPSSPYARFFDIDWNPAKDELRNKILLPFLGEQFGQVLESGGLKVEYREGAFVLRYYERTLPLDPKTWSTILAHRLAELKESLPAEDENLRELESIVTAAEYLPDRTETDPARVEERQREKEVIKRRLANLTGQSRTIEQFIHKTLDEINGNPDDAHSFDLLNALLDMQVYRLSHWKAASDEINYRRFFDINELTAVSMEEPEVFEASHALVFDLLVSGKVSGLRIDHIDGLFDPCRYLWQLQWGYVRALGRSVHERLAVVSPVAAKEEATEGLKAAAGQEPVSAAAAVLAEEVALPSQSPAWEEVEPPFLEAMWQRIGGPHPSEVFPSLQRPADGERQHEVDRPHRIPQEKLPLYVVVEKILGAEEPLPEEWPVAGTTGYDFLNTVNRLLVDPAGLQEIRRLYSRFIDQRMDFREVVYQSKLLILRSAMSSELQMLAYRLNRISERHRRSRDFTLNTLRAVLREIVACFPVYRTYIDARGVSDRDRRVVQRAVAQAKRRNPATDAAAFDFVRDVLLLEQPPELDEAGCREREFFVGRFQQVTSPVIAKGVEDTAFYRYNPLTSLNEVGGEPSEGAMSVEEFHRDNLARAEGRSWSLIASSTHDTKRSEDVRARINVLAEIPQQWRKAVNRWSRLNRRFHHNVDGQPAPSRNDEYLFYQALVGMWPLEPFDADLQQQVIRRMQAYMEKATHEAKLHTSWITPHPDYDQAMREFVGSTLESRRFLAEFQRFHERVVDWGLYTALAQTVLKLTSPGIPDIYQGQEVWSFRLVDPDNREPVDFARHWDMLNQLEADTQRDDSLLPLARHLAHHPRDPRIKLLVSWRVLQFRRRHRELFHQGTYLPLEVTGSRAKHVCAFAWRLAAAEGRPEQRAVVVAPRLLAQLTPAPEDGLVPPLGESVWGDTRLDTAGLSPGAMKNLFTGQTCEIESSGLPLAAALADFPVAVLTSVEG
jgi:(1->4)-alpha-D-glucan 1-alpha-D-glucosylmutase